MFWIYFYLYMHFNQNFLQTYAGCTIEKLFHQQLYVMAVQLSDICHFQTRKVLLHHWNHQIWLFSDEFCRAVGLSWPDQQHLREVIITCKQKNEQPILRMTFNSMITELILRYWRYSCVSVQRRSFTNQYYSIHSSWEHTTI